MPARSKHGNIKLTISQRSGGGFKNLRMISVKNVTLAYGKRVLFDEVNLNFTKGNCYGVIGANGAGKSTFLKILSGEIEPNKGTVEITPGERMAVLSKTNLSLMKYCVEYSIERAQ